jgi:hypothetical protein
MKRMIRYAADNNFDAVAWTTGKQQSDRYSLAKHIDQLEITKTPSNNYYNVVGSKDGRTVLTQNVTTKEELIDLVGTNIGTKAINQINKDQYNAIFQGLDLQIGGEGMYVFYDQKVKGFTEKYIKQWGAKLETLNLTPKQGPAWDESFAPIPLTRNDFQMVGVLEQSGIRQYESTDDYKYFFDDSNGLYSVMVEDEYLEFETEEEVIDVINEFRTEQLISEQAVIHDQQTGVPGKQPGFALTPAMTLSVVEKGQPWFKVNREPRYQRIVDYTEETTETSKRDFKDLFNDQAYATLKALSMQLPKNQPSMHWAQRYILSPEWYDHPTLEKIVKAAINRHDRYYELFNTFNEMGIDDNMKPVSWNGETNIIDANVKLMHKGLTNAQIIKGETSKEYKQLERMKDEIDTGAWKRGYGENVPTWEQHFRGEGIPKEIIDLYKLHRKSYDKALDVLMDPMKQLVAAIEEQAAKDGAKPKFPEFTTLDDDGKIIKINLKQVLANMGQLRGTYAPRLREPGEYVIKGKRGDKIVRYHKPNRIAAELLKRQLERKGYTVENVRERERLPEDVYTTLRIINTQKAIETAVKGIEGIDPELEIKFNEALLTEVADLLRVRGFRASMLKRQDGTPVRGYITDPNERFVRYMNNISAGVAKGEAAKEMFGILAGHYEGEGADRVKVGGIDPVKEPRAYNTGTKYIEEQLRNSDVADRIVGLVKSVATLKYLGFNPRSVLVNIMSLATTVPVSLHMYAMGGKGSFVKIGKELAKASVDYKDVMRGKKLTDKGEQGLVDEIKTKGYDTPQYTRDAIGTIQRTYGKAWTRTMYWAMYMFGKSEQWIRGTTMLAGYRLAKVKNPDATEHDLIQVAHTVSNKAHGIYGKATQLAVGQGTGPAARLAQILYTYGKFAHNNVQLLYDTGMRKGNIKAFAYGLLSPIIIGGLAVMPFKDAIFGLVGSMLKMVGVDDDPEKGFWDWIRDTFGLTGERIGRHGALGAMNLDVSSSMSIGVGLPRDFYEMFGIAGGLAKDYQDAKHFLEIGQPGRATEKVLPTSMGNIFRAIRELKGITTTKGQPVWDEQGKPYIPSDTETALRLAGFRTARQATMGERTWETKREIDQYRKSKAKVLERWRNYIFTQGDEEELKSIMDDVVEYNNKVIKAGKTGEIPLIDNSTLKQQAKTLYVPNKGLAAGLYE